MHAWNKEKKNNGILVGQILNQKLIRNVRMYWPSDPLTLCLEKTATENTYALNVVEKTEYLKYNNYD